MFSKMIDSDLNQIDDELAEELIKRFKILHTCSIYSWFYQHGSILQWKYKTDLFLYFYRQDNYCQLKYSFRLTGNKSYLFFWCVESKLEITPIRVAHDPVIETIKWINVVFKNILWYYDSHIKIIKCLDNSNNILMKSK